MLHLNEEQLLACKAPLGHNLVIASAGTGKTSTIVGRIATLLERDVAPSEILLLTFTNKAAQQMMSRLLMMFDEKRVRGIEAGTFHAVSYRYLKNHTKLTLKQPRELKMLLKSLYPRFVDCDDAYKPEYLFELYSLYQNQSVEGEGFYEWLCKRNPEHEPYALSYESLFNAFESLKNEYGYAGFNDLLLYYRQRMRDLPQSPYIEILVDEYQDTNPLQDSVLRALAPKSLFCVGDYDQSIYAFNGADISIIASFKDRFADSQIFNLSKNYRSSAPILQLANRVIAHNERIYPKKLEVTKTQSHSQVRLFVYDDIFEQYRAIAEKIAQSSTQHADIAVIFRNNSTADGIEAALREHAIPSKKKGGISFFESKEIALMLDLLTLFHNPKDMMAFVQVMSYAKGVGSAVGREIYEELLEYGQGDVLQGLLAPKARRDRLALEFVQTESVTNFAAHPLRHSLHEHSAHFLAQLHTLALAVAGIRNATALIAQCEKSTFLGEIFQAIARTRAQRKDMSLDKERYLEALEKIHAKIKILSDLSKNYKSLEHFLNAMVLGSSEMNEGNGVNLLSIHSAKGLEYHEVYVIDLMDGRFPNYKLMAKSGGALEEERRLFYVAATRAKENLYFSFARAHRSKQIDYQPSIFLKEAGFEI
ncbi:MAG: ATP-dependent helicase [Helicobacter sp.]|nr:ATP-dependent helicase [Helicobacter sp.]